MPSAATAPGAQVAVNVTGAMPAALAVIAKVPATVPASAVTPARPAESVIAVGAPSVALGPDAGAARVADGPVSGAANDTVMPGSGWLAASLTRTPRSVANAVCTTALCTPPAVTVTVAGAPRLVSAKVCAGRPGTVAVTW